MSLNLFVIERLAVLHLCVVVAASALERQPLTPDFPVVMEEKTIAAWKFERAEEAWPPMHQCSAVASGGVLRIESQGNDPYLRMPMPPVLGPVEVRWRMRGTTEGPAQFFWGTVETPGTSPTRSVHVQVNNDGKWHDYRARIPAAGTLNILRFDPCISAGTIEVADARVVKRILHPLQFERLEADGANIRGAIRNTSEREIKFTVGARSSAAKAGETVAFEIPAPRAKPFEMVTVQAQADDLPPLTRMVHLHHADIAGDFVEFGSANVLVRAARDGSGARILWKGQLAAIASPLAERDGVAVTLQKTKEADGVEFAGGPVERLAIRVQGDEVVFDLRASERVSGPAIRVIGGLEQGLLAGVEHLGKGEMSSSTLDLETPEHIRFEPDPLLMTMPLAAYVTERSAVAMLWNDPESQPVFSTPNRYDGTADHLMAVKDRAMQLRVRLGDGFANGGRLEDAVLWAVKKRGLPELPPAPRTPDQQRALNLAALNGPIRSTNGWGHVAGHGGAQWFGDHASTIWRLTGELSLPECGRGLSAPTAPRNNSPSGRGAEAPPTFPPFPALVPGGAHVENWASYFVTGRAREWLNVMNGRAAGLRRGQQADGSWRYGGKFRRGHFEDTASSICAHPTALLLEHAQFTGTADSLAAGLRGLEFMKRFRTPRGAQTWEIPLHTPDILASAWLVRAYVRGYELTRKQEYLDLARRWALSGVPFVYQWGRFPVMRYATTPVLGATDWTSVVWIGLPVQWCGTVYAYALLELAPHDQALDWRRLAEGILVCSEQMQYPDGPRVGCLPDSFNIPNQRRQPADINPCALVSLRLRLAGELDSLSIASDGKHRIVAPFPVTLRDGKARIAARASVPYEVVVDGARVVPITSRGTDELDLELKTQ